MPNIDRPIVMGILNATPDSFSDGTPTYLDLEQQLAKAMQMISDGADIIDIGGESTRPGSSYITAKDELKRVIPLVKEIRKKSSIQISIDTNKAIVAEQALQEGANIINDITSLTKDPQMIDVVAKHNAGLVLMHMQGTPKDMQRAPKYNNTVQDVISYLEARSKFAIDSGVDSKKIIIDPGFGFGKTFEDNCKLLQSIKRFITLGFKVLIGVSRKSMIQHALGLSVSQRLEASLSLAVMSYLQGAQFFRVHDVLETRRALDMIYKVHQV